MSHDQTFRAVLILASLVLLPIAVYHRLKSQATGEKLDRWQEGVFILFTLRPVGVVSMLGLLAYMANPSWMAWSSVPLAEWLRWTGVGVGVIAGALLIWTLRSLGKNLTDTVVTRREHTLVTRGPYRWVRHPFYDAVGLSVLANSLVAANWFLFLTGGLLFLLLIVRTRTEEERLLARFGDSYRAYMKRTGRFLPRVAAMGRGA
jgi:protein-S-isoprenylcysteine O-methyltransferase Ste14